MVAKKRPLGMAPRQWPARPTRCMATATARVVAIWQTRSMVPMSMPSSSEAVAMRILHSPDFQALLGVEAERAGEGAVVRGDGVFAEAVGELEGDLLDELAGVDEDQRGAVLLGVGRRACRRSPPTWRWW